VSTPIWPITSTIAPALRSATASSPLKRKLELVWSACARTAATALTCARTNTSPSAIVPTSGIVAVAVGLPLAKIWTS
jgi:hypothetical protein